MKALDPRLVDDRLRAWESAISASPNPARLAQRWRYLGWSSDEARTRLAGAALFETPPPDQARPLLECGLARLESSPLGPLDDEVPFGEIFRPLAHATADGLAGLPPSLVDELTRTLAELAAPALISELSSGRLGLLPPRREPYARLAADLRAGGLRSRLHHWPVLARELALALHHWRTSVAEFLERLARDRDALAETFPGAEGGIIAIDGQLGDAHRGGRRVMGLTFADGRRLIYKPRGLRMDVAWHDLIEWLRVRNPASQLRAPHALDRGDYGWVEFVAPAPPDDLPAYYRSAGELLALAWICSGSDFHEENVIATANGPVLIDLETLFTPTPRPFGATDAELAAAGDAPTFDTGVLTTLLLPVWQIDERGNARDLSGFSGAHRARAGWHEPTWIDLGTDRMRQEMRPAPDQQPGNVPRDAAGHLIPATPFVDEVVTGFTAAARTLLTARDDLPLAPFRGAEIRFLVRNTQIYGVMRQRLLRPEFLRSAIDRSIEIEKLARPFLPPDPAADRPEVFKCYEAERRGLENGDIPIFHAHNDEMTLRGDGGVTVRDYFWRSGWQNSQDKLRQLDASVIAEQAALVRASLTLRYAKSDPAPPDDWLGVATSIAGDLAARAIPLRDGGISWLSFGFDPLRKMQNAALMGLDLYSGSLGVAIFLAALTRVTGESRWLNLALDSTRPRLDEMRRDRNRPFLTHLPLGVGSGLGSLLYGSQLLANLTGQDHYLEDAAFFAKLIGERPDTPGDIDDLLGGGAGAILALVQLHAQTGDPSLLESAIRLGDTLLARRVASGDGLRASQPEFALRPLTGLAHGAAGFAWALSRLGEATGESRFLEASTEAIAYERSTFRPDPGNWPDFRRGACTTDRDAFMWGWCSGAPGVGLARIAQGISDTETRTEINVAIADARHGPALTPTHLCCGETARIELLLEASKITPHADLREAAVARARPILTQRNEAGHFPLTGADCGRLFAPSFFQGTTGVGYTFLRLLDPSLPSVASLQPR